MSLGKTCAPGVGSVPCLARRPGPAVQAELLTESYKHLWADTFANIERIWKVENPDLVTIYKSVYKPCKRLDRLVAQPPRKGFGSRDRVGC